jgi:hypothetical protein
MRRLAYLLLFACWLALMLVPAVAFVLATKNQIQVGSVPAQYVRLFLISEPDAQGIGLESASWADDTEQCVQTAVSFLMWEGQSDAVIHCQCFDGQGGVVSVEQSACRNE